MKGKIFFTSIIILLIFTSISSSGSMLSSNHSTNTQEINDKAIFKFRMVKILMPLGSNIKPNYLHPEGGIHLHRLNLDIGWGIVLFNKLTVDPGPITVQPLIYDPMILNTGDTISVLFGTYHYIYYYPSQSEEKFLLIGRFYGVTVEKYV